MVNIILLKKVFVGLFLTYSLNSFITSFDVFDLHILYYL